MTDLERCAFIIFHCLAAGAWEGEGGVGEGFVGGWMEVE